MVEWAKFCYKNYPTIVNNIPKSKKTYDNTLENFACVDNNLAKAQEAIGISSNIAQLAQTYTYNFNEQKYKDYVCILSVLAQIAIDSAKRAFDIDINLEIDRISKDMNISNIGYPAFWKPIQDKKRIKQKRKLFPITSINKSLVCPMNYLLGLNFNTNRSSLSTLPMNYFFNKYELETNRRQSKKVEELIEKYSLDLYDDWHSKVGTELEEDALDENSLLLRSDFDQLIEDIKKVYISKNYIGLMSWLIDRAFLITPNIQSNKNKTDRKTNENKALLLKVLYDINPQNVLQIFSKNA